MYYLLCHNVKCYSKSSGRTQLVQTQSLRLCGWSHHRALRGAARWRPPLHFLDDVLLKIRLYQLKHPTIAHALFYALQKLRVGNGVEVASKIGDRKSTRLNSSHSQISYAVFCLKKKTHGN